MCLEAFASGGKTGKNKSHMCPVEAGGRGDPGGQAASQGCGWLSGPLPFPATESEEGTQAGHQPCRFDQLLAGEGRAGERRKKHKQPPPVGLPTDASPPLQPWGSVRGPQPTLPPGLSPEPNSRAPWVGNCLFPRMQLVTGTQVSSHLCGELRPSTLQGLDSPSVLFPSCCPYQSLPPPESGLPDSAPWRSDG